jgi:hypothetical protein
MLDPMIAPSNETPLQYRVSLDRRNRIRLEIWEPTQPTKDHPLPFRWKANYRLEDLSGVRDLLDFFGVKPYRQ